MHDDTPRHIIERIHKNIAALHSRIIIDGCVDEDILRLAYQEIDERKFAVSLIDETNDEIIALITEGNTVEDIFVKLAVRHRGFREHFEDAIMYAHKEHYSSAGGE